MNYFAYKTPFGHMTIASNGEEIIKVVLGDITVSEKKKYGNFAPNTLTNLCANQLLEYFSGKRMVFDVPAKMNGTDFQLLVWDALVSIPYGQVRTPKEIAVQINNPNSYRLVSKVAYSSELAVLVPSHRLIAASGQETLISRGSEIRQACRELEKRFM